MGGLLILRGKKQRHSRAGFGYWERTLKVESQITRMGTSVYGALVCVPGLVPRALPFVFQFS